MYISKSLVEQHFRDTEKLVRQISKDDIASWLLSAGYFPESNILPPSFKVHDFKLQGKPYNKEATDLTRRQLAPISYPKSLLTNRVFAIQDPRNYHDIVFYLHEEWETVLDRLYPENTKIFSYSMPIPVDKKNQGKMGCLRTGRMIYEWIRMAESDLVIDATSYKYLAKTDITNFYSSVYTHSLAWALAGNRETAFEDKECSNFGNKIDKLLQYANDARTNGIPVGSALSDLVAEILLAWVDEKVSKELSSLDFLAVRFKDDYRVLCNSEEDAKKVLSTISNELSKINLTLNENKTQVFVVPDGLYRPHDREYFPHSLREKSRVSFKTFEHTLLIALDIHRKYPGTGILEKFFSELLTKKKDLKLKFSKNEQQQSMQLIKFVSLLFLVKRESEKTLSHVLSLIEIVYLENKSHRKTLKPYIKNIIEKELQAASNNNSAFDVVWYIFFWRYIQLGAVSFKDFVTNDKVVSNPFVQCMLTSTDKLYSDSGIKLFRAPKDCKGTSLAHRLDVFKRHERV
ncbi:RNA-directed DNA polymerase [Vibrio diabolicus]|uniref:RNA-directed DNA polymerase n=1 Tax=Vibrio diabolicus TaxID=50719 RepID=UPI003752CE20|nr:RNA-directed DNA polymerase [Vibrio alginolyticus]